MQAATNHSAGRSSAAAGMAPTRAVETSAATASTTVLRPGAGLLLCRGAGGADARLSMRASLPMPISAFDPAATVELKFPDSAGTIFDAPIPAGSFVANAQRTHLRFHDRPGTAASG